MLPESDDDDDDGSLDPFAFGEFVRVVLFWILPAALVFFLFLCVKMETMGCFSRGAYVRGDFLWRERKVCESRS